MPAPSPAATARAVTIRGLLSYRLHRLANLISSSAALRYRRDFSVSLAEWRTIALLGADAPLSLNDLARAAGLHKSQMSRVVTGLVSRGLVERAADERDARGIRLTLARRGRRLYRGLIHAARERNDRLLGCLRVGEQAAFATILQKLEEEARALRLEERRPRPAARGRVRRPADGTHR
jgi:DNA-binding MarR family transcriptional regulator